MGTYKQQLPDTSAARMVFDSIFYAKLSLYLVMYHKLTFFEKKRKNNCFKNTKSFIFVLLKKPLF